jgi:hypothetical protein
VGDVVNYVVDNYPNNLRTFVIAGNHDNNVYKWSGVDVCSSVASERNDVRYLGQTVAFFDIDKIKARSHLEAAEPNLADILQADLADEVEAEKIYTAQAEIVKDQAIRAKLLEIAASERQHAEGLTKLLDGLTDKEKAADTGDVHVDAPSGAKLENKEF